MNNSLRRCDLIRAALQGVGVESPQITDLNQRLVALASGLQEYRLWNQELSSEEVAMVETMLSENGKPHCEAGLFRLTEEISDYFGISEAEIRAWIAQNRAVQTPVGLKMVETTGIQLVAETLKRVA